MVGTILLFIIRRLIILYIILAIILSGARNRSFSTSIFQVLLRAVARVENENGVQKFKAKRSL